MSVREMKEKLDEYPDWYRVHVEIVREQGERSSHVEAIGARPHDYWMAVVVVGEEG